MGVLASPNILGKANREGRVNQSPQKVETDWVVLVLTPSCLLSFSILPVFCPFAILPLKNKDACLESGTEGVLVVIDSMDRHSLSPWAAAVGDDVHVKTVRRPQVVG